MTETEYPTIWTQAILPLKEQFQSAVFSTVLAPSQIKALSTEELIISVENSRIRDFIRRYAEPVILLGIREQTGISPQKVTYSIIPGKRPSAGSSRSESFEPQLFQSSESSRRSGELEASPQLAANLNPKYTFSNFVVGAKNRLAYAAAQAVGENPGTLYNPLYIYGGVGLGKTHLMQAIGNAIINKDPQKRVIYVACENFMNEFVSSIKRGNPDQFKKKYRNVDVFLVDDIQFIAGRDGIQEEFFHTFNALHQGNKQIVMTSDKVPSDIKGLEERLSSRFSMGMITDIQLPDQATRLAILQTKCQEKHVQLPEHILQYIADQIETNIRELEGALTTVVVSLQQHGSSPNLEDVRTALRTVISNQKTVKKNSTGLLAEIICQHYGLAMEDLIGPCRQRELVRPRQILMYLLKHEAGLTYPVIGREIGGRDHTTIMYGVEKITKDIRKSPDLLSELQVLKEKFYEYK